MGKYNQMPFIAVKARNEHQCSNCGKEIQAGEHYYRRDGFLQSLHIPKFCSKCFQEHGAKLLERKKIHTQDNKLRKLDSYFEHNKE